MRIPLAEHEQLRQRLKALEDDRRPHWALWRELADFYLPRRYIWLQSEKERRVQSAKNPHVIDSTGILAARTLASGMMNGITSPARPWFKLRAPGFGEDQNNEIQVWLDLVAERMLLVMAESNFYNAMAVLYLDLVVFGTAAMLIYEDYESVIRCYNPALGEFYLAPSARLSACVFAREFTLKTYQLAEEFGEENLSETVRAKLKQGGAPLHHDHQVCHLVEPNRDFGRRGRYGRYEYVEYFWERGAPVGELLRKKGFAELPGVFPRWELSGNDAYGSSPAMDALGDVIQLQHETKKKAQALDKMVNPPMVADIQLQHRPSALLPGGITFVSGQNNVGMRPAYQIQPPINEITLDIREVQFRIRETFHNDLFKMISQLDTVRSATEIDARREEKLVLLGPVLERFENEALDPAINRIFGIMSRAGLVPPAPEALAGAELQVQYVSILSVAQRALSVAPTERWLQLVANITPVYPKAVNIPNWDELIRNYGRDIGVSARDIHPPETSEGLSAEQDQLAQQREAAATGQTLVSSAQQLSQTDVGGGANALQQLLGGGM